MSGMGIILETKMNKKIEELAEQSGVYSEWLSSCSSYMMNNLAEIESFAQLLIKECAAAAELHARSYSDGDAGSVCHGAASAVRNVGRADESA